MRKVSTLHVGLSPLFANPGAGAGACSARRSDQSRNGIDGNDRGRPNSKTRHTPPPRDRRAVWSVGAGPKAQTPPLSVACTRGCGIFRLTFSCRRLVLPRTSPWRRALRNSLANEARSRVRPPVNVNEQISGVSAWVRHEEIKIEEQPAAGGVSIAVILDQSPPAS